MFPSEIDKQCVLFTCGKDAAEVHTAKHRWPKSTSAQCHTAVRDTHTNKLAKPRPRRGYFTSAVRPRRPGERPQCVRLASVLHPLCALRPFALTVRAPCVRVLAARNNHLRRLSENIVARFSVDESNKETVLPCL